MNNEEKYKRGDKRAIMEELHWCLAEERPLPKWLRSALLRAAMQATFFDIDSTMFLAPPV
jgi:hypothetical protein